MHAIDGVWYTELSGEQGIDLGLVCQVAFESDCGRVLGYIRLNNIRENEMQVGCFRVVRKSRCKLLKTSWTDRCRRLKPRIECMLTRLPSQPAAPVMSTTFILLSLLL